ncbi:uncharacterized protein LOC111039529 [Myzus persicae]|uniref:uncharacterized protein LOC111039529 n=1 Tax=Myzus persicae TaxID=13164 RepID=UPI000B938209|nr:uncharacterized protein LOC111039529 [Myzus persicae]
MDAEVDSAWICTQAVVSTDSQSDNEQEKINNYGCIFLNDMIDNGRYVLKEGDNTIGRHPLNHIYIDHPSVSMNHAVIQCDSDGVVLLDKGSLNKTKLNKKTLRKDVAYFLEENALLVFGEVRANYCMNEESNEFTNDTKSRAPHNTSVDEKTQNDGLSLSKLSNAAITPKSVSTDIPNVITDCNLSLVIENSSSCKIEKEVPKTVIGTECAMNTINDIHTQLNSSSPSDEYLLETLSQVEAKQNSNGIFHNLSNEDTTVMNLTESVPEITQEDCPSPVMDLKSSILTTSNVANNQFVSPNKINTEAMREDTPSPVMDLKNSIITTNNISTIMFQSPSQIKTKLNREDTPSPIMDLGCYDDFGNNLETINYGISAIQSPNKVDEFDNTQVLEIDNNIVELYTKTSNNDDILFYKAQKVKSSKQSNTQIQNSSDIQSNDNLSNSKNINLDTKCNEKPTKHFCRKNEIQNDNFNSDTSQNTSMLTSFRLITATDGHNNDEHKRIINTFEADDDEVFRNFIENECKSQQHDLAKLENQDFFNCPTQKISINKNRNIKSKLSSSVHDEETHKPPEFKQPNKMNTITSKIYTTSIQEENIQIPEIEDDFFNCPTQKLPITKKIQPEPKVPSSIYEEETQIPLELKKLNKIDTITSKNYNTNIHEENTQIPEMDDDFFNCPTQKLSISKIIPPKPKVSSSIYEEETQIPLELKKLNKIDTITSKNYNTNIHEENTQIPEMDDDFFNCPTQKLSISKIIPPKPKVSSSIHEEETQIPVELKKLNKIDTITSKNYNTNIQEDNTQISEMDDDFFNCPTQKVSISKIIPPKPKVSSSIHEEETQIPVELKKLNKIDTITSKNYNTNIQEDNTQISEMDDDFFNCPTQKVSISKIIPPKPKVSSSIHEEETQIPVELKKLNKIDTITSKNYNTNIQEDNTQISEMDDDFFNCPTQKVSISKIIPPKPKVSSSIHEEETQIPVELKKLNKIDTITSKNYNTNIQEDNTQISEMDDDFFNCPTQKVSISKIIPPKPKVSSSIHEEETQIPVELKKLNKIDTITSKNYNTNIHEENTQIPEMDDDFFNCPTQKLSISKKIQPILKVSSSIHEEETQKPLEFSQFDKTNYITSNTINIQQNKGNIVNCTTQKCQSNSISNCSINIDEDVTMNPEYFDVSNNHKQIVEPVKEDRCKVQKSKCVKSTIKLSNVQLPVNCNEKSSNSLKINKPKIRVREDLHMSCSGDSSNNFPNILNKPNENAVSNNINTTVPFDKNFDSPGCSNTTTIKKNDLNASSSTKQKHFTDDSVQSQVTVSLKYKHQMKRMDESIFSPLNIPDVSANSLLEHHSSPKTTENKLNTLNCEPSTSCNDAIKWKSFWNKKKVQSQGKGISDKQKSIKFATEVKENKERYQTRAITRKRKQNGVVESNKKICSRNKILEPLVENSSEIVVSFSYLKSRHLQEMKQFVDQTGGTVTDEITQCSVLVTDKIRCTMKILSAIARGCPIVNVNWLKHSYTVKMFQDFDDFIIVDKDAERKYKFQLKESLAKAKAKRLLDGYNVLVTPSVKPGPQEMKVIITCAGGNYVLNWTTKQYSKELIVTCDKDRTRWKSAWDNEFAKIIDSDTLVMSIIRQKLTI